MGLPFRRCLRYRLSRPACLLLLIAAAALGMAQCTGRFAYSMGAQSSVHVFGWPLIHSAAVSWDDSEDRKQSRFVPFWSLVARWYWSSRRLCIDALLTAMLLAGTVGAAELHLRRWPQVQFALSQLLMWTALSGALMSVYVAEPEWARWLANRIDDATFKCPLPWVTLNWYIRLPVMFSLWCVLDLLAQGSRGIFNRIAAI